MPIHAIITEGLWKYNSINTWSITLNTKRDFLSIFNLLKASFVLRLFIHFLFVLFCFVQPVLLLTSFFCVCVCVGFVSFFLFSNAIGSKEMQENKNSKNSPWQKPTKSLYSHYLQTKNCSSNCSFNTIQSCAMLSEKLHAYFIVTSPSMIVICGWFFFSFFFLFVIWIRSHYGWRSACQSVLFSNVSYCHKMCMKSFFFFRCCCCCCFDVM